jgi:peptidoglycan/LPS O-acetylase OafA/YrhL
MQYVKFTAMIISSTILMFIMMYLNTYAMSHIWFSETRTYMALYMGAGMAIVMLIFMWGMYKNKIVNIAIVLGATILFAASVYLVRSQASVEDGSWMKAMIPHHSIAILTSSRANIEDARVRKLANSIIAAQQKEIKEMEWLIADIEKNGIASSKQDAAARPVPAFSSQ